MKNLVLALFVIIGPVATTHASSGPTELFKHADVEATVELTSERNYILFSSYDTANKMMDFILENPVNLVQIYKENGELEMMVPVGSDEVSLGLSQFKKGTYKVGFILEGVDTPQFMNLTVK